MKKIGIYILFYLLTLLSLGISILLAFLGVTTLIGFLEGFDTLTLSENAETFLLFLLGTPVFVFCFQLLQDANYWVIHRLGYWAQSEPAYYRRGVSLPRFYEAKEQSPKLKASIAKAQYRYRLVAILQWLFCAIVIEGTFLLYLLVIRALKLSFGFWVKLIGVALIFVMIALTMKAWGKFKRRHHLEVAYTENDREFYYRRLK